jgi:hypothetical protein
MALGPCRRDRSSLGETVSAIAADTVDVATYRAALARIAELERENEMLAQASASIARRVRP